LLGDAAPSCRDRPSTTFSLRDKRPRHIVDAFFSWCDAEASTVRDDTPISNGIPYARYQRVGLSQFLDDGRLRAHADAGRPEARHRSSHQYKWMGVPSIAPPRVW
jgi:hypothetical protein